MSSDNNVTYVLRRSNGMIGVYADGKKQENLLINMSQRDDAGLLFDAVLWRPGNKVIFTTDEEPFRTGLPGLKEYIRGTKA